MGLLGAGIGEIVGLLTSFIFSFFENIDISGAEDIITGITKYIRAACYFLPMNVVSGIFIISISLWNMRLIIRIIKTIWELIPIL